MSFGALQSIPSDAMACSSATLALNVQHVDSFDSMEFVQKGFFDIGAELCHKILSSSEMLFCESSSNFLP